MILKDILFGFSTTPEGRDFKELKSLCVGAEKLGFDLFSISDHFMNMANPDGPDRHPLECWSTLAGLAAVTSKIMLAPLVSCYHYRHPTVLAKMATTVDIISNGRLIFGIGAGWHETEFKGYFGRFPPVSERMLGLEETIQICKSMFTHERTSFAGKLYHVDNVLNSPPPVQKPIPIMVGGGGERKTLKIAAKYANISHFAFNPSDEDLDHKLAVLRKHCGLVSRDFKEIKKGISLSPLIGLTPEEIEAKMLQRAQRFGMAPDEYRKRMASASGTPAQWAQKMRGYIDKGIGLFTTSFLNLDDAKLFADHVIPEFR